MGKALRRVGVRLASLLACCSLALALDPSLDVSQYAHTAWKIRDGVIKTKILAIRRRRMVIYGWARTPVCFASMACERSRGSRPTASIFPASIFPRYWSARDGSFGLAHTTAWPVGRTAG